MADVCLAVDKGISGAMLVMRRSARIAEPNTVLAVWPWRYRSTAKLEQGIAAVRSQFGLYVAQYHPGLVAWERSVSIPGRRHVVTSQANMGGRLREWAEGCGIPWVEVSPQTNRLHDGARALYGPQLRLYLGAEDSADCLDACNIGAAALWEGGRQGQGKGRA